MRSAMLSGRLRVRVFGKTEDKSADDTETEDYRPYAYATPERSPSFTICAIPSSIPSVSTSRSAVVS